MKKILSYALIVAILVLYAVPIYAASGGWTIEHKEPANSANPIDNATEYMETTVLDAAEYTDGVSGNVLHIKFSRAKTGDTWLYAKNSLSDTLVNNQKYDFSFYAKGTFNVSCICIGIGTSADGLTQDAMINMNDTGKYTVTSKGNGWSLYQFNNLRYKGGGSLFGIMILGLCDDLYIDNVSLVRHNETGEIIIDGGFEETDFTETEDVGNQSAYAPTNLIATQRTGHIMLSWRNPENTNLSKVSLYDITTGEAVKLSDTLSKTPKEYVNYDVTGLEEKSKHTYKVVYEFGKATTTEAIVSGTASDIRDANLLATYISGNHPGTSYIEHDDVHSGNCAARIISNKQKWEGNNYIRMQTGAIAFNESKEYEISLWIKGTFAGDESINYLDAIKDDTPSKFKYNNENTTFTEAETDANGWKNVVFKVNGSGTKAIAIMGESRTDLLVDDIEVYEFTDGVRAEKPLFSQDFESAIREVAEITSLSGEVDRSTVKINFTAPEGVNRVRVYVKDGDNFSKRADVFPENGTVTFNRLKNDYNYTYVVKAVETYNKESDGKEITLTPTPNDWECFEYGLYKGVDLQDSFKGSYNYTVKAILKNNKVSEGFNAQVIAFLRKNGERIDAAASDIKSILQTGYDEDGTEVTTNISVPDVSDGEYEISVYLWDGLDNMTILQPFKIYKEVQE